MVLKITPIALHTRVTVDLMDDSGNAERRVFTIVTAKQADFKSGLLDENTPLGRALLGHCSGETVPYVVGDLCLVRILLVESTEAHITGEVAEKRRQAVRQAAIQSEITNQMIFATASGSKWGDYDVDVDKLLKDKKEDKEK